MGTRSQIGWNSRCTHRGPGNNDDLFDAMMVVADGRQRSRADRQWAKAIIKRHARFIRTHIDLADRTQIQRNIVEIHRRIAS